MLFDQIHKQTAAHNTIELPNKTSSNNAEELKEKIIRFLQKI